MQNLYFMSETHVALLAVYGKNEHVKYFKLCLSNPLNIQLSTGFLF